MATTTTTYDPLAGYNIYPSTQAGSGAYGAVPGPVQIPPNLYSQVGAVDPALYGQTTQMGQDVTSQLMGELSPETQAQLQQSAAQFGVSSGMPGSGFEGNYGVYRMGQNVEALQNQGIQNYLSSLHGLSATMTPQQLAADIAERNATMASAPNPQAAADQQMQDWQNKFAQTQAATTNPSGGTGAAAGRGGTSINPSPRGGGGIPVQGGGTGSAGGYNPNAGGAADTYNPANAYANWQALMASGGAGNTTGANPFSPATVGDPYGNGQYGGVVDSSGDEWVPMTGGTYMNLTTGELQGGAPDTSGGYGLPGQGSALDLNQPWSPYNLNAFDTSGGAGTGDFSDDQYSYGDPYSSSTDTSGVGSGPTYDLTDPNLDFSSWYH